MRRTVFAIVVVLLVSAVAAGESPQIIPGWADMRQDMELFKGALDRTVGSTVLNTYIPGYGVIFVFAVKSGLAVADVQRELNRALMFITPTIGLLPSGEVIAISGYREELFTKKDWELLYISRADSSASPDSWDVFFNQK